MASRNNISDQKTVLLGVTGCIAAYKSAEIVRELQKSGIRVKVVMTEHAHEFIGSTTFRALTREPVAVGLFDNPDDPIHHISLAQEADLFLIAPCTANVIAKIAGGIADDILTTTALATEAPLVIAPAMNVHMYEAAATRNNFGVLLGRGVSIIEADDGYLACGDTGRGRLADVNLIVSQTLEILGVKHDLEGKKIIITAGPTEEKIDPVRCITNHSSGKMGYELAKAAVSRGANVTLVSGPVSLPIPERVSFVGVRSAEEMLRASEDAFMASDIAIFSAAVCDVRPKHTQNHKIKKTEESELLSHLTLVENPDILATLAAGKRKDQIVVGFAAETNEVVKNGINKLKTKHADIIVANEVGENRGFGMDTNKAYLIDQEGVNEQPEMLKAQLANLILDAALALFEERK